MASSTTDRMSFGIDSGTCLRDGYRDNGYKTIKEIYSYPVPIRKQHFRL